jgi:hypothetical protein
LPRLQRGAIPVSQDWIVLEFTPGGASNILDDTGAEPGALALMAFALSELYNARIPYGPLTLSAYEQLGGVHGVLGKRAAAT